MKETTTFLNSIPLIVLCWISSRGMSKSLLPKLKGKQTPRNKPSRSKPIIKVLKKLLLPSLPDFMFSFLPKKTCLAW